MRRILLVEDDPGDAALTLTTLGEHNLANEVMVALSVVGGPNRP